MKDKMFFHTEKSTEVFIKESYPKVQTNAKTQTTKRQVIEFKQLDICRLLSKLTLCLQI